MNTEYEKNGSDRSYTQNEHVVVAEKKLGRKLGRREIVHHVDENKFNNDPDNLMVLRTSGDHMRIHSDIPVEVFQTEDGSHVVVKRQYECPHCLRYFEPNKAKDIYCSVICSLAAQAAGSLIPTKEVLAKAVWEMPSTSLCKLYGVSDTTIKNWCRKYGIEKPPRGYWLKA